MKIKLKDLKTQNFKEVVEALINSGHDISIQEKQSEISLYLPSDMFSIVLNINGTWKIE